MQEEQALNALCRRQRSSLWWWRIRTAGRRPSSCRRSNIRTAGRRPSSCRRRRRPTRAARAGAQHALQAPAPVAAATAHWHGCGRRPSPCRRSSRADRKHSLRVRARRAPPKPAPTAEPAPTMLLWALWPSRKADARTAGHTPSSCRRSRIQDTFGAMREPRSLSARVRWLMACAASAKPTGNQRQTL